MSSNARKVTLGTPSARTSAWALAASLPYVAPRVGIPVPEMSAAEARHAEREWALDILHSLTPEV